MSEERCEKCRFWKALDNVEWHREGGTDLSELTGQCRRRAPVYDGFGNDEAESDNGVWPMTTPLDWCGEFQPIPPAAPPPPDPNVLARPVRSLGLSSRILNCLAGNSWDDPIITVGELIGCIAEDLLERRNFGNGCLAEVRTKLAELGLKLKGD